MQNKNRENYTTAQSRKCAGCGCVGEIPIIRYDRKLGELPILRIAWVGDRAVLLCADCRAKQRKRSARRPGGRP